MTEVKHGPHCKIPYNRECQKFSTDGTRLGADIAHQFGTTSEREIMETESIGTLAWTRDNCMTGMDEEQQDWEGCWGDDDD